MLTLDKIYQASYVLKEVIRHTDLIYAPQINPDSQIYLKTGESATDRFFQSKRCLLQNIPTYR